MLLLVLPRELNVNNLWREKRQHMISESGSLVSQCLDSRARPFVIFSNYFI